MTMQVSIFCCKADVEIIATVSTRKELEKLIAVLEIYKEIISLYEVKKASKPIQGLSA